MLLLLRLELQPILMVILIVIVVVGSSLPRLCQVVFQRPYFVQQVVNFEVDPVVPGAGMAWGRWCWVELGRLSGPKDTMVLTQNDTDGAKKDAGRTFNHLNNQDL